MDGKVCYSNYMTGEGGGLLGEHADSVECIAFCVSEQAPYCVSCAIDTKIHVYSLKEHKLRQKIEAAEYGGFSKIEFSTLDVHMFYAASTLGHLVVIDVRSGALLRTYKGHAAPINGFLEVPEHKVAVTVGDDFLCNIYDLTKPPKSSLPKEDSKEIKD